MHSRNTVRYYLLIAFFLIVLFFSNDFGLLDIQKTALIMAVGIDREDTEFIVTTQIALPQSSEQTGPTQALQIESRGETIAEAIKQINSKTGWYPKFVFCNLIVIGEEAAKRNVFDALDFFLSDEYMSDNCYVATCEGTAKKILNTSTPIDPISSVAVQKILSTHAQKVGAVVPNTLREFSIGYFDAAKSGYLPILKVEQQQDSSEKETDAGTPEENTGTDSASSAQGQSNSSGGEQDTQKKEVFSANETALFYNGVMVEKLTRDETFAFDMVNDKLQLASYPLTSEGCLYTLHIKKSKPDIKVSVDDNSMARLNIKIKATAGVWSAPYSRTITELTTTGAVPPQLFESAEEQLKEQILRVFDKSVKSKCDLFDVVNRLQKSEKKYYSVFQKDILERLIPNVEVKFESLR